MKKQFIKGEEFSIFKYKFVKEIPLTSLNLKHFQNHHRLKVFCQKGTKCVNCNKVGTRLILGNGRGQLHWDIYTDDGKPITVDHIIPKSKGGGEELENKQPMCYYCNRLQHSHVLEIIPFECWLITMYNSCL